MGMQVFGYGDKAASSVRTTGLLMYGDSVSMSVSACVHGRGQMDGRMWTFVDARGRGHHTRMHQRPVFKDSTGFLSNIVQTLS